MFGSAAAAGGTPASIFDTPSPLIETGIPLAAMGAVFCEALFDNSGSGPGQRVDGRSSRQDREPYGPRPDYKESLWWKLIHNPQVHDPNHRMGKQFRHRFRVPFEIF